MCVFPKAQNNFFDVFNVQYHYNIYKIPLIYNQFPLSGVKSDDGDDEPVESKLQAPSMSFIDEQVDINL